MRIEVQRTGGFAGMHIDARIDTEKLPEEQAIELESLIDAAGFFELPATMNESHRGTDRFTYRISVETEGKKNTIETDDEAAPTSLRPLLRRLMVLARSSGQRST